MSKCWYVEEEEEEEDSIDNDTKIKGQNVK